MLPFQREDRDVAADTVCEVAGWGTTDHSGTRPDKLHQVERPVISRDVCNHRTRHDGTITHNMMCTDSRRKDTCKVPHTHHGSMARPLEGWEEQEGTMPRAWEGRGAAGKEGTMSWDECLPCWPLQSSSQQPGGRNEGWEMGRGALANPWPY